MDSPAADAPPATPDLFRPTVGRCLLAAAVAFAAFWLPQEIPLEYYPLNNPSSGLQYLEITCKANVTGTTEIFLDTGRGFNDLEKISWPIGPSEMAYTYTFPLADAPLFALRLNRLLSDPGETTITNFRIINRRGNEIDRLIGPAAKAPSTGIAAAASPAHDWRLAIMHPDDPQVHLKFDRPLIAEGMNVRNLERCLLSVGYLTLMLWILLLAVYFAFRRDDPLRGTLQSAAFLLFLSLGFSFVGNRGLVKNSVRYARIAAANSQRSPQKPAGHSGASPVVMRDAAPVAGILGSGWFERAGQVRWIGRRAGLTFQSGPLGKVTIKGYLPDYCAPNEMSISDKGELLATRPLQAGIYTVECPVERNSLVRLSLEMGKTVVPKALGINGDTRELGSIIIDISTE